MPRVPSLPGIPGHLRGAIVNPGEDDRPERAGSKEGRRTRFIQGRRVSLASAILNLVNAIVGSGVLGLPFIAAGSGLALFLVLLLVTSLVIDYSLQMVIASALATRSPGQPFSYERMGEVAFGTRGRLAVSCFILLQNTGNITSYFRVFADIIGDLVKLLAPDEHSIIVNNKFLTLLAAVGIAFPIACSSKIGFLAYVGVVQIVICVVFVTFVASQSFLISEDTVQEAYPDKDIGNIEAFAPSLNTFLALPTLCFSFVCHTAIMPVYDELQEADSLGRTRRSQKRMSLAVHCAIAIACTLYALSATFGYLTFKKQTNPDLLINYSDTINHKPSSIMIRILFALSVLFSIPLQCFPFRRALTNILEILRGSRGIETWLELSAKNYTAKQRADVEVVKELGVDLEQCSAECQEFLLNVVGDANTMWHRIPPNVSHDEIRAALGHYCMNIMGSRMRLAPCPPEAFSPIQPDDDTTTCPTPKDGWLAHVGKTVVAITICLLIALYVPAITTIFAATGATSCVALEFIFPSAIFMKVCLHSNNLHQIRHLGSLLDVQKEKMERTGLLDDEDGTRTPETAVLEEVIIPPLARIAPRVLFVGGILVFVVSWTGMLIKWCS